MNENYKCNYIHLLDILNNKSEKMFTVIELCEFLEVSNKTLIDFRKGKIFNFELLYHYSELIGVELLFEIFD